MLTNFDENCVQCLETISHTVRINLLIYYLGYIIYKLYFAMTAANNKTHINSQNALCNLLCSTAKKDLMSDMTLR